MKINWKVRLRNKAFWLAFIPALALLVQSFGILVGFEVKVDSIAENLLNIINAVFVILAVFGVVNDPTTAGMTDSEQALGYEKPREDVE